METVKIAITETMDQVHKHFEKYLALHREILDGHEIIARAVAERWGDADPRAVLEQAEVNSLEKARMAMLANPKKNPWKITTCQGDLFNTVAVRVPSVLMIDGTPTPYYEASIVDWLQWWNARRDAKSVEEDVLTEAADTRRAEKIEAKAEGEKLEALVQTALDNGVDPKTVKYARAQAEEN